MRCLYVDLDGTLLGPDASLLRDAEGGFALEGVRALQACFRAGAEVVVYSGRNRQSVFNASRLIGSRSYIFELGCGVVIDGELEWLTGRPCSLGGTRLDLRPDRGLGRAGAAAGAVSPAGSSTTRLGR